MKSLLSKNYTNFWTNAGVFFILRGENQLIESEKLKLSLYFLNSFAFVIMISSVLLLKNHSEKASMVDIRNIYIFWCHTRLEWYFLSAAFLCTATDVASSRKFCYSEIWFRFSNLLQSTILFSILSLFATDFHRVNSINYL